MPDNLLTGSSDSGNALYRIAPVQAQQQPSILDGYGRAAQVASSVQGLQAQQFALGKAKIDYLHDQLGALAAKPDLNFGDVTDTAGKLVAMGVYTPQQISQQLAGAPQDPAGLKAWVSQHLANTGDFQQRMAQAYGQQGAINNGAGTQFYTTSPRNPAILQPGSYVPNQPGPGLTEGPSVNTPAGPQQTRITNQQAYDVARGQAKVVNGQIVYPSAGGGGGAGAGAPAPQPTTPLAVGAPAGAAGAADVASQGSANQGLSLQKASDNVPQQQATIDNMRANIEKFTSGPMAARFNQVKKGVNQLSQMAGTGDVFDPKTVAAQEEFHKQAEMLSQQAFSALGGTGSDQQLASAKGANPNDSLSGLGNKQILSQLEGLQDAVQAKNSAWQSYRQQNGDASYGQFSNDFNKSFSPRAFMFARMSPADRQDFIKTLNPNEQRQLGGALANAEQRGWIKPGGQ